MLTLQCARHYVAACYMFRARHSPSGLIMAVKVIPLTINAAEQSQIISELEVLHKVYVFRQ